MGLTFTGVLPVSDLISTLAAAALVPGTGLTGSGSYRGLSILKPCWNVKPSQLISPAHHSLSTHWQGLWESLHTHP